MPGLELQTVSKGCIELVFAMRFDFVLTTSIRHTVEGNQDMDHAKRIAEFAVDAVAAAGNILIDEDEPEAGTLHIRVGFHSGAVVSNVIGSLNPRYGLFGDTMNTAARMEGLSTSDGIQCSEASARLLREQAPGFPLRRRGKIAVKGKGQMTTYWVGGTPVRETSSNRNGRDGFDRKPVVDFQSPGVDRKKYHSRKIKRINMAGELEYDPTQSAPVYLKSIMKGRDKKDRRLSMSSSRSASFSSQ